MSQFDPSLDQFGKPIQTSTVLMASSSLSASTAISVTNFYGRGAMFFMNITSAFPGSASTTYTLKIKTAMPNATASSAVLCACSPRSASGAVVLVVYPGAALTQGAALTVAGFPLPLNFTVVASLSTGATSKEVVMSLGMTTLY